MVLSQKAQTGFEPAIFGLRDRRLTTWPLRRSGGNGLSLHQVLKMEGRK
jgi:hypothetical protein